MVDLSTVYCIEISKGFDEDYVVEHAIFLQKPPTKKEVIQWLNKEDIGYDPDCNTLVFYPLGYLDKKD